MDQKQGDEHTLYSAQEREPGCFDRVSTVDEVRQVEVRYVVADDDVRVDFIDELRPSLQHFRLVVE